MQPLNHSAAAMGEYIDTFTTKGGREAIKGTQSVNYIYLFSRITFVAFLCASW